MPKSKSKIEQKAITKVRDLIDKIEFFKHDLKDTDKNISWDGTVEMYNGNTDIKENERGSLLWHISHLLQNRVQSSLCRLTKKNSRLSLTAQKKSCIASLVGRYQQ